MVDVLLYSREDRNVLMTGCRSWRCHILCARSGRAGGGDGEMGLVLPLLLFLTTCQSSASSSSYGGSSGSSAIDIILSWTGCHRGPVGLFGQEAFPHSGQAFSFLCPAGARNASRGPGSGLTGLTGRSCLFPCGHTASCSAGHSCTLTGPVLQAGISQFHLLYLVQHLAS